MFLEFVRGMLAWRPEDRKTAAQGSVAKPVGNFRLMEFW